MKSQLEKSILATLCYFDVFDYPLTFTEIWKWWYDEAGHLEKNLTILDIQLALENSQYLKEKIETKYGFYFLKGREGIIEIRKARYNIAEKKYKKVIRIVRLLRYIPFIKMIAVCNTLACNNSRQKADIDLLVITQRRRVWQTRFWISGLLKVFGLRPSSQKKENGFCASFFVDEDNLNLEHLAIRDDIYLPYWIVQVFPIYDEGIYERFIAENQWVKKRIPNFLLIQATFRRRLKLVRRAKKIKEAFFKLLPETIFKNLQLRIMPQQLKTMANNDTRVVVQDGILKFHDNDRREYFKHRFWKKLQSVEP